jgi:hypothetical protein
VKPNQVQEERQMDQTQYLAQLHPWVVVLVPAVGHFLLEMVALVVAALLAKPVVLLFQDREIMVVQDPHHPRIKQAVVARELLVIRLLVLLVLVVLAWLQVFLVQVLLMLAVAVVVVD